MRSKWPGHARRGTFTVVWKKPGDRFGKPMRNVPTCAVTAATLHVAMTVPDTDVPARIGLSESRTDWIAMGSAGLGHGVAFAGADDGAVDSLSSPGPGRAAAMPLAQATAML